MGAKEKSLRYHKLFLLSSFLLKTPLFLYHALWILLIATLLLFTDLTVFGNLSDLEKGQTPYLVMSTASAAAAQFQMNSAHAPV